MYRNMSEEELLLKKAELQQEYANWKAKDLHLDMARGKPCAEQLTLSNPMNDMLSDQEFLCADGQDARNYGGLYGLPEARELFAELLDVPPSQVIVNGSSSLLLMYLCISHSMTHGVAGQSPWAGRKIKFLCPSPGYDRHFSITEHFGIEMITISMCDNGPDMDKIEQLVASDDSIKGMWLVPKYQNPTGVVFSDEVVDRLVKLQPAAVDFRIYWDNAYCVHDLYEEIPVANIISLSEKEGNPDIALEFASFSKVTYPGASLAALASSKKNIAEFGEGLSYAMVSPDKVNQLRHIRFLQDKNRVKTHMNKHADILRPKFEKVLEILTENFDDMGIASWTAPKGGYFISVDILPNTAKRTYELCKEAGLTLTTVGATFPYGKDPEDKNIRIAPSYPSVQELEEAAMLFTVSARLAALEKLTEKI